MLSQKTYGALGLNYKNNVCKFRVNRQKSCMKLSISRQEKFQEETHFQRLSHARITSDI